jgi:hypothetical protein
MRVRLPFAVFVIVLITWTQVSEASGAPQSPTSPAVKTNLTPKGWVPITYGDGQISVPSTWLVYRWGGNLGISGVPISPTGLLRMMGPGTKSMESSDGAVLDTANSLILSDLPLNDLNYRFTPSKATKLRVNGFVVARQRFGRFSMYQVAPLGVSLVLSGPLSDRVLQTLTYSPRAVVMGGGRARIPQSWRRISFAGLEARVPRQWPVLTGFAVPVAGISTPACGAKPLPILGLSRPSVSLNSAYDTSSACLTSPNWTFVQRPRNGLLIDRAISGPVPPWSTFAPCLAIHALSVCPTTDAGGALIAEVHIPGKAPVAVGIGLAGGGQIARDVLDSFRASK